MDLLKSRVGSDTFLEFHNEIRDEVLKIRESGKRKRALEKINNPEMATKRKLQKKTREKARKRRNMERVKYYKTWDKFRRGSDGSDGVVWKE
eukprot:TRINITY_DN16930_c0_g1_i1.p1 TRINITY_DN16930_c0_g1~~TRINITY_DN16930_c0_g1_i1.p1  ORF type:complete len:92 (-),score=18.78 TRINITY_DN16930_c0_g1_i1:40-315(-)